MKLSCKTHVVVFFLFIFSVETFSQYEENNFLSTDFSFKNAFTSSLDLTPICFGKYLNYNEINPFIVNNAFIDKQPINDIDYIFSKKINQLAAIKFLQEDLTLNSGNNFSKQFAPCSEASQDYCIAQDIIKYSKQFIGSRYRRGAKGPNVFDCSGFTSFVFKKFGIDLSGACIVQVNQGTPVKKEELKTGDLIFFKGRNIKSARIGHVGIVVSNDNGNIKFIHACNRGVIIDELDRSSYYRPRYVKGLRVLSEEMQG